MIIALELDNIVCTPVRNKTALADVGSCEVLPGAKEALEKIKKLGHVIMIYTKRDPSLCLETEVWLQKNKIPYDHVVLDKPEYDLLVDSNTYKFDSWKNLFKTYKQRLESK